MKVIKTADCRVMRRGQKQVGLTLPVGERNRQVVFDAEAAQRIGTLLANAGFDQLHTNPGYVRASAVRLRPYDASGDALIELTFDKFGGPAVFVLGADVLTALAQSAQAALEFGAPAGEA